MIDEAGTTQPVVFTVHGREPMHEHGAREQDVLAALRFGEGEPGLIRYRFNVEFKREWDGRYYGVQQIVPVVDDEAQQIVVVTVYTFCFQEGESR